MSARTFRIAAVAVLILFLQQAVMGKTSMLGVHPDVLLLFALCVAITGGAHRGAIAGFAAGLAADVFLLSPLGLGALSYAVAAFTVGSLSDDTTELPWVASILAMFGSVLGIVLFVVFGHVVGEVQVGFWRSASIAVVVALVNGVLAPFVCRPLRRAWVAREVAW